MLSAYSRGDEDQVDGLLCGAMKTLKVNRLKPDQMIYLTLLNLAKRKPVLFTSKRVFEVRLFHLVEIYIGRHDMLVIALAEQNFLGPCFFSCIGSEACLLSVSAFSSVSSSRHLRICGEAETEHTSVYSYM